MENTIDQKLVHITINILTHIIDEDVENIDATFLFRLLIVLQYAYYE
jgi:hypothetical protein